MSKKILIIDDDKNIIELNKNILEKRGHQISIHTNGENALSFTKDFHPDLVILDHVLPGKLGTEICHELKSDPDTKEIPVLMTTGQALMKEPTGGDPNLIKPDAILIKPFEIEELLQIVNQLLG